MRISYNKLWKLLIDKNMNKKDLKEAAGISSASVAKLGKSENITTDVLLKICVALNYGNNRRLTEVSHEITIFKYPSTWNRG